MKKVYHDFEQQNYFAEAKACKLCLLVLTIYRYIFPFVYNRELVNNAWTLRDGKSHGVFAMFA